MRPSIILWLQQKSGIFRLYNLPVRRCSSDKRSPQQPPTTPQNVQQLSDVFNITPAMLDAFAELTGDHNPIHHATKTADGNVAAGRLVHGALLNSIVAGILGTRLPGAGTIVLRQEFEFPARCLTDRPISVLVQLANGHRKIMQASYECRQDGRIVFEGNAKLMRSVVSKPGKQAENNH